MTHFPAYGFVDGGYLRKIAAACPDPRVDPYFVVFQVLSSQGYQISKNYRLVRVIYYDARPDDETEIPKDVQQYWDAIEHLDDTHLGFGSLRGQSRRRPPRQKGVDTLLAVDMLVGAFTGNFSLAILVAGDADFVPVITEIKRRGPTVIVAAEHRSASSDLIRAADRYQTFDPQADTKYFRTIKGLPSAQNAV